jgi:hypothetical protein
MKLIRKQEVCEKSEVFPIDSYAYGWIRYSANILFSLTGDQKVNKTLFTQDGSLLYVALQTVHARALKLVYQCTDTFYSRVDDI